MPPWEKQVFIINISSLSRFSVTHSAAICDSTAGENFTENSLKNLMVKRDPESQDAWLLFLALTLTHVMLSAHFLTPPEDTEKIALIK